MTDTKKCPRCGEVKPLEEFYKDKRSVDGHHWLCKRCQSIAAAKYYKTERGKKAAKKRNRRYYDNHYDEKSDSLADYINSVDFYGNASTFDSKSYKGSVVS